jgi:hypothetical protein
MICMVGAGFPPYAAPDRLSENATARNAVAFSSIMARFPRTVPVLRIPNA